MTGGEGPGSRFSEEQRLRFTTLALKRNLQHVRWREKNPLGMSNEASVGLQLTATFLLWIATSPLEQVMTDLDSDPLSPKLRRLWTAPDFQADDPEGLRFNLPRWRTAIAQSTVEVVLAGDGWTVVGLRAWLGGESPWVMTLGRERLDTFVDVLAGALPFWRFPVMRPGARSEGGSRSGKGRTDRTERPDEP